MWSRGGLVLGSWLEGEMVNGYWRMENAKLLRESRNLRSAGVKPAGTGAFRAGWFVVVKPGLTRREAGLGRRGLVLGCLVPGSLFLVRGGNG